MTAQDIVDSAVGQLCWRAERGHGSFLTFEFGERVAGPGRDHGEWHLWVYFGDWALSGPDGVLATDPDDKDIIEPVPVIGLSAPHDEQHGPEAPTDPTGDRDGLVVADVAGNARLAAMAVGWLDDGTEQSLRAAMAACAPTLADLPIKINASHAQSNPLWRSSSAVIDGRFVVKFAWSEVRAIRLWREGMVLERLWSLEPFLPTPELVVVSRDPALVVTRRVAGVPLSWEWASGLSAQETTEVARQIAAFLVRLHGVDIAHVLGDLPEVHPTVQADTKTLRRRFPRLVDNGRAASVMRWCDWVDRVLDGRPSVPEVLVHGDLHGYNQVWDPATASLLAVVDFEESGVADRHFDLRYLPSNAHGPELVLAVIAAYERLSGQHLDIERIMAWHVLTALGDALWRTEAGVALPGGGTATTYVDALKVLLAKLDLD